MEIRAFLADLHEHIEEVASAKIAAFTRGGMLDLATAAAIGRLPIVRGGTGRSDGQATPLPGSVTRDRIADDAIGPDQIDDDAVGPDAIADDAVGPDALAEGTVTDAHVAVGADIAWSKISKTGAVPGDVGAAPAAAAVPTGGSTGQVLTKTSSSNYAVAWQTPSGGGGGGSAPLDEQEVTGSPASSITLTVPTPTNPRRALRVFLAAQMTAGGTGDNVLMRLNSDSGANYRYAFLYSGASSGSGAPTGATTGLVGFADGGSAASDSRGHVIIEIPYPDSTAWKKGWKSSGYRPTDNLLIEVEGQWASTSAVTSITLIPAAGSWAVGSIAALYGVD